MTGINKVKKIFVKFLLTNDDRQAKQAPNFPHLFVSSIINGTPEPMQTGLSRLAELDQTYSNAPCWRLRGNAVLNAHAGNDHEQI